MPGLFTIKDTLANKIALFHLLLLMGSLPFDMFYSHLILISLIIHTAIQFKKTDFFNVRKKPAVLHILSSVFLITVYSTAYAADRASAYNEWGRQILILLFPLVFYLLRIDLKKYRNFLLMGFSLVCTATVCFLYLYAVFTIRFYGLPLLSLFSHAFANHNFSAPVDIHATFFSMQLGLSLIFLLSLFLQEQRMRYRLLLLFCMLVLSAGLIQLSSKSVCCCMFLLINLGLPWFLNGKIAIRQYVLVTATVSLIAVGLIFSLGTLSTLRERFVGQLRNDLSQAPAVEFGDSRLSRWNIVAGLIARSPVTGYGAGSEIPLLRDSFFEHQLYRSFLSRLNAHNQYLSFLLKSGVIGLLIYLATLLFGFRKAIAGRDLLFFAFVSLIAFVSLSENLLDVNKGIIFYAFFFSFFIFSAEDKPQIISG